MNRQIRIILGVALLVLVLLSLGITAIVRTVVRMANHGSSSGSFSLGGNGDGLNDYVKAYNKLHDTFGFMEEYASYQKADIAHATVQSSIFVNDGWIPQGIEKLQDARKGGGPGDLKDATDDLIDKLTKVETRLSALKIYYDSKAYVDDNLARGKQEDAQMLQELDAANKALSQFGTVLDKHIKDQNADLLSKYKSNNDMLNYDSLLAMQQAKEIADAVKDAPNRADAALYQQCDGKIAQLEVTLADLRKQTAAAKGASGSDSMQKVNSGLINTFLTSMIGNYRELKMSQGKRDIDSLLGEYNSATEEIDGTMRFAVKR